MTTRTPAVYRPRAYQFTPPAEIDGKLAQNYAEQARLAAELANLRSQAQPLEEEYAVRRWTRAFLVENSNGHVHKSQRCSTCFATTDFSWLTDCSGKDEIDIIDAAGEKACTTCYPDAPVEVLNRASRFETTDEAARSARAAERGKKVAEKNAKLLLDPGTGLALRGRYGPYKTERGAELEALADLKSLIWYGTDHPDADEWVALARRVAHAKAAKHSTDADAEFDAIRVKAERAHQRETGDLQLLDWLTYQ